MTMRWGVFIAVLSTLGAEAAQAQTIRPLAVEPATSSAPPLQLRFPRSYAATEPFAPGASWAEPVRGADDGSRRFRLDWQDPDSQWDISAAVNLVEESKLNAADFQTGGLFETEAAVVHRFGDFRIGAVGYSARGVGEDVGRGPKLGPMRWKGSAAGPVIGYDAEVVGQPATFSLRWYREIGTPGENGDTAAASFALRF